MVSIPKVKEEQYQFVIQFLLDICCIPHVDKASINETYYEEVAVKIAAAAPAKDDKAKEENKEKKEEPKEQPEAPKTEKVKKERNNVCMLKISECNYGNSQTVLDVKIIFIYFPLNIISFFNSIFILI